MKEAIRDGLCRKEAIMKLTTDDEIKAYISRKMYSPDYVPLL